MPLILISPTARGYALARSLESLLTPTQIWTRPQPTLEPLVSSPTRLYTSRLSEVVTQCWFQADQLVFILATGAVLRLIAPLLGQKHTDPGVVVVDESGRFVISLCGGHQGGADALARQVAAALGVEPVITSASAGQELPAVDLLGDPYGWQRGSGQWLEVAAALARRDPVRVIQTCGWDLWQQAWQTLDLLIGPESTATAAAQIWISDQFPPVTALPTACWHPRTLWVGVGCERGVSSECLEQGLQRALQCQGLTPAAVAGVASVDLKQDEGGLVRWAKDQGWPLRFYSPEQLRAQPVPSPSDQVLAAVGTPSVAEAAALLAAQTQELVVPKQIYRDPSGACTIAIARAQEEYSHRQGQIQLVGTGPGDLAQLTLAARRALTQAEVVVGYQRYVDLVKPLLAPEQIIEVSPITQEVQRAQRAIELARRGLRVVVISSGDAGIYGMAGLVLECLHPDQNPPSIPVEVLPGISAFQAVAARVGAPLMHDFCAISLSDLLTPWPVIEQRLTAAATADFVVALYNPRSQKRTEGIEIAQRIFLQHRSGTTPVVVARSVFRPDEDLQLTTLQDMVVENIDMLTLVLIGNGSTRRQGDRLITPRGYRVR